MKFLPLEDFEVVSSALKFDTPDCQVTGGCDLYTTKAAGADKKLYKTIETSLESQHAALLKLGASLSPPERQEMAFDDQVLSRSSPFGDLAAISNRRTYAYLIATLNASHPDYDFSHVLRPADFKRERNIKWVVSNLDNTLSNVRPSSLVRDASSSRSYGSPAAFGAGPLAGAGADTAPLWGPAMWAKIDKEMMLKDCTIFSYQPQDNPFEEEEGSVWSFHYLFFNKSLKRVAYLYVRAVPVTSHSPRLHPQKRGGVSIDTGATKRAKYWLGDQFADRVTSSSDDELDDGYSWNRDKDGELGSFQEYDDFEDMDEDTAEEDEPETEDDEGNERSPIRGVSEDIASRMEIE